MEQLRLQQYIKGKNIIFVEEGIYSGSFSMNLSSKIHEKSENEKITSLAIKDSFVIQEKEESIFKTAGIDKDAIKECLV